MSRWTDWAIATGVATSLVIAGAAQAATPLGYAFLAASGLALAARRSHPRAVLAATGLTALGYQATGLDVPVIAFLFAVYATMRAGHHVVTVAGSVLMLAALPLAVLLSPRAPSTAEAFTQSRDVLQIAWLIAAAAAGEALRQAEKRADEAERTREETALRRANEERLHIARELHDSLTHQISVIKLHAEVAVHLARKREEDVPDALLAIRDASREATRELRATLEALRDDTEHHGLHDVPDLVHRARSTGLDAQLTIEGHHDDLPAAVDRTAYRIVQESLTNITRHAHAATARIHIDHRQDALVIRVDDDGTAPPTGTPGVGIRGMRERVTALGGHLDAAPRTGGGFCVQAELPVVHP
ncbi:two-component sensor histidine kinase [Lentzea guizhouensis]|uniref:histidine kinase n=1 Tax=Lentzea guizhouensis TaxID=1586287 RepID=A0A1B2HQU8_9PSEU|nr:histidine kinase [Lentzea guizhouensis]ANZ40104.1 two-component sensor histidine kinase [Lentzea guizhouensis]